VVARAPIIPERVRRIDRDGFAFIPNRFLRGGFFVSLTRDELALYVFLVLAGDRNGISFYHYDRICSILELPLDDYLAARNGLIENDLIAFDGTRFQVLSLPSQPMTRPAAPLRTAPDLEEHDSATIRSAILDALDRDPDVER
jgi:hypothetical protein